MGTRRSRSWAHAASIAFAALVAVSVSSCASCGNRGPKTVDLCAEIQPSPDLNYYEGAPHSVAFLAYELSAGAEFMATPVDALLAGERPPGVIKILANRQALPGDAFTLEAQVGESSEIGIVAGYQREHGTRKAVFAPSCKVQVVLAAGDVEIVQTR